MINGSPKAHSGDKEVVLAGIRFRGLTETDIFSNEGRLKHIITVNSEAIVLANENTTYRHIINDNVACFDGQIPLWLARHRSGLMIRKLAGSDLIFGFARFAAQHGYTIFLLGDDRETNARACAVLRQICGAGVNGYSPPHSAYPFDGAINQQILDVLRRYRPHIVLVGFGMPKQELWINDHRRDLEQLGVRWVIGVGGSFGFVSGKERRAPKFVQAVGMEGLWRLVHRPSRWRRFLRVLRVFRYAID